MVLIFLVRVEQMEPIGNIGPTEVALKLLAAPINPSDINMVCWYRAIVSFQLKV
jgi:NADPH:quinone reductase-like Zn-dependent oxidoreductase